ncbi:MAG: hypothetical protein JO362_15845 [Streptomycetaceae bacterium]|nr:hypothetical protein [Streptomycetaceae bacterium]
MHWLTNPTLEAIEEAARQATARRAKGLNTGPTTPEPSILAATSEREGVAELLRHRLQLPPKVRLGVYEDSNHPLFPGARLYRAARIQLSYGQRSHLFIGAYEPAARLTFSLIAPCRACSSPVPSARIDSLADFGDWLLGGLDRAAEAPQFRTSPIHRRNCPIPTS